MPSRRSSSTTSSSSPSRGSGFGNMWLFLRTYKSTRLKHISLGREWNRASISCPGNICRCASRSELVRITTVGINANRRAIIMHIAMAITTTGSWKHKSLSYKKKQDLNKWKCSPSGSKNNTCVPHNRGTFPAFPLEEEDYRLTWNPGEFLTGIHDLSIASRTLFRRDVPLLLFLLRGSRWVHISVCLWVG